MAINRLLKKTRDEVLRTIAAGKNVGIGCDSAMILGSLEFGQSPFASSISVSENIEDYLPIFRNIMSIEWEIQDTLNEYARDAPSRNYNNETVALAKEVISALAIVLESALFVDQIDRHAVRWAATVTAIHHGRKIEDYALGLRFCIDLSEIAGLEQTKFRLEQLLQFVEANGTDSDAILSHIQEWENLTSIEKGVLHACKIEPNCDSPLFQISNMGKER